MEHSRTFGRLQARGDALRVHFDLGLRAYDAGEVAGVQRHRSAVAMLPEGGPGALEYLALRWRELWLLGERDDALVVATEASRRYPDDPEATLELGDILVEVGRFDAALDVLLEGARKHPEHAEIWYETGLAAERVERWEVRSECFQRVWALEHEQEGTGARLWLPEERFVEVAEETLERLSARIRQAVGNVAIFVEDYPDAWIFETEVGDPRVLGLFDGPERAQEAGVDFVATGPARIYLFRRNIERMCRSAEEVEEQVEITVLHEVGHYLGLDEEELHLRGLG